MIVVNGEIVIVIRIVYENVRSFILLSNVENDTKTINISIFACSILENACDDGRQNVREKP